MATCSRVCNALLKQCTARTIRFLVLSNRLDLFVLKVVISDLNSLSKEVAKGSAQPLIRLCTQVFSRTSSFRYASRSVALGLWYRAHTTQNQQRRSGSRFRPLCVPSDVPRIAVSTVVQPCQFTERSLPITERPAVVNCLTRSACSRNHNCYDALPEAPAKNLFTRSRKL